MFAPSFFPVFLFLLYQPRLFAMPWLTQQQASPHALSKAVQSDLRPLSCEKMRKVVAAFYAVGGRVGQVGVGPRPRSDLLRAASWL